MDTATLVNEQIDEGQHLIRHLNDRSFPVIVAFWVLTSDELLWHFYIASYVVDKDGLAKAYRKLNTELLHSNIRWISRSDIKLVGAEDPIALDALKHRSDRLPTKYGGRKLGNLIVEEAYIYPG